jgi:hypothetical protein
MKAHRSGRSTLMTVVREFNSDRKDQHWGKRKLKRDERRPGDAVFHNLAVFTRFSLARAPEGALSHA